MSKATSFLDGHTSTAAKIKAQDTAHLNTIISAAILVRERATAKDRATFSQVRSHPQSDTLSADDPSETVSLSKLQGQSPTSLTQLSHIRFA